MKVIVDISSVALPEDKRPVFAELCGDALIASVPFRVQLDQQDQRVERIVGFLHGEGFRRWSGKGDLQYGREYSLILMREYEPSDFAEVEYVEHWPELVDAVGDAGRDEQGLLRLERPTLRRPREAKLDLAYTIFGNIVVREAVKEMLMEGEFRHLIVRPTTLVYGKGLTETARRVIPWDQMEGGRPWWELSSDLILPPVSETMELRDWHGKPVGRGDVTNQCIPREGLYNHVELRYRRSDLEKVGAFDVALTYEPMGLQAKAHRRHTVASKRFYDYCQEKKVRGRWAPVRVEEG